MLRTTLFRFAEKRGYAYDVLAEELCCSPEELLQIQRGERPMSRQFQYRAGLVFSDVPEELLFFEQDERGAQITIGPAYQQYDRYDEVPGYLWREPGDPTRPRPKRLR